MATNLAPDAKLILQAIRLGKHKTKKDAVTAVLKHYVKARQREGIRELVGKVDFHDDFGRNRR